LSARRRRGRSVSRDALLTPRVLVRRTDDRL